MTPQDWAPEERDYVLKLWQREPTVPEGVARMCYREHQRRRQITEEITRAREQGIQSLFLSVPTKM